MADETSTTRSGAQEANVSRPRTRSRGRLRSGTSSSAGGESTEGKPTSPQTGEAVSMQQDDAPALYIGKYKVTHALGKGSFADVYRAEHSETGELVAIKAISIERLNPQARKQLNSEVEILKKFKHENVVKLIDVARSKKTMHLILEFCDGGDVSTLIKRHGRFKESQVQPILKQLASGVAFLRENNLIHRDLKPQNLLLSGRYPSCTLKIADFGFARSLEKVDMAETLCGSPLYMAPEILNGRKYDHKCDLWSVGAIMYELLSGKPPYTGSNHMELVYNINNNPLKMDSDIKRQLSKECLDLIRGLLRKRPQDRMSFEDFWSSPFIKDADSVIPDSTKQPGKDTKDRTIERLEKAEGGQQGTHASPLLSPEQNKQEQQNIASFNLDGPAGTVGKSSLSKERRLPTEDSEKPRRRSLYSYSISQSKKLPQLRHDGQCSIDSLVERLSLVTVGNIITVAEDSRSLFESSSFKANTDVSRSFAQAIFSDQFREEKSENPTKTQELLQNAHVRIARHSAFCARALISLACKFEKISNAAPNQAVEMLTKKAAADPPVDIPRLIGTVHSRSHRLCTSNFLNDIVKEVSTVDDFESLLEDVHANAALCAFLLYSRALRLLNHCTSYFAHFLSGRSSIVALLRPTIEWLPVSIASCYEHVECLKSDILQYISQAKLQAGQFDADWIICCRASELLKYADMLSTCDNFGRSFLHMFTEFPVDQVCLNFRLEALELLHSTRIPHSAKNCAEEKVKEVAFFMEEKARNQIQKAREAVQHTHDELR